MRAAFFGLLATGVFHFGFAEAGMVRGTLGLKSRAPAGDSLVTETVVYVDPLPEKLLKKWGGPNRPILITQQSRRFRPRVVAVAAGSSVQFQNKDRVYHNVFSVSPVKRFDLGKYPPQALNQVTFDKPGVVNLFCDIHPGMAAYVIVLPHRFYTRPDHTGAFALPSLPPGSYTLRAWHPALGRLTRVIEIPRRGDLTVQLKL